jgi:hypothetical protein
MLNEDFDIEKMAEYIHNTLCRTDEYTKTFQELRLSDPIGFEEYMTQISIAIDKGYE